MIYKQKAMAPHSSTLAWKIPWTEEPGGLQSMGSQRADTTGRLTLSHSLLALILNGICVCMLSHVEKAMATHSSILAWRIPGTEEPSGLPSMGSHRAGHD